jgi:hypothetical protein
VAGAIEDPHVEVVVEKNHPVDPLGGPVGLPLPEGAAYDAA